MTPATTVPRPVIVKTSPVLNRNRSAASHEEAGHPAPAAEPDVWVTCSCWLDESSAPSTDLEFDASTEIVWKRFDQHTY